MTMVDSNGFFFRLTPDIVLETAERQGFAPSGHMLALNSLENRVYSLRLEDASFIVMKFYRPGRWSYDQVQEEHDFLFDLARAEIPVCCPLELPNGSTIAQTEGIFFSVWPRTGGRQPEELTPSELVMLGRLLGRLHAVGRERPFLHRRKVSTQHMLEESLAHIVNFGKIPKTLFARLEDCVLQIAKEYEQRSEGMALVRIHGDCHKGNVLRLDAGFFLLDFDDAAMGPPVQDFWMLADPDSDELANLIAGYEEFGEFPISSLSLIPLLRLMRYVHYAGWIAKRWSDPIFPAHFPHFGTEDYWENEVMDLERGIEALGIQGTGEMAASSDMSNADFFWDWEKP